MQELSLAQRQRLLAVARGESPADLFLRGGTVVNVYSGELLPAHVAVAEGRIAYVGMSEQAIGPDTRVVDLAGRYVAPGFIEAHTHPWVMYNPVSMVEGLLPLGTTLACCDNLNFYLTMGAAGCERIFNATADLPMRLRWVVRPTSQSELPDEDSVFAPERLAPLLAHPAVVATGETPRWTAIQAGHPRVLSVLAEARRLGKRNDGHTSGASYERLNTLVAAGVSSCHEAITAEQALDRLRLGLWTLLRHSSLRPDLPELLPLLTRSGLDTRRIILTVDGPSPGHIADVGYLDEMLRQVVAAGVPPVQALQMVTLNPATFLGLDEEVGGIAPGRLADLVVLPDLEQFRPDEVYVGGRLVAAAGRLTAALPAVDWAGLGAVCELAPGDWLHHPELYVPQPLAGESYPVIEFISNVITRGSELALPAGTPLPDDLVYGALVERHGRWVTRTLVRGFATQLEGMASTYNTSNDLLVLGRDPRAMARAAARVRELGGGIVLATADAVTWEVPLPVCGLMVAGSFAEALAQYRELVRQVQAAGFPFHDILYALCFLACDFLPGWRLTPRGLLDVRSGQIVQAACSTTGV